MTKILFFGRLAQTAGLSQTHHPGGLRLSQLVADLGKGNEELGLALMDDSIRVARNLDVIGVGDDPLIEQDDEVAFMPPLSGG